MNLADYITEIRLGFFAREPDCQDLSDDNFTQGIKKALREYSRFRGRVNCLGTVEGATDSRYLPLPSNFMMVEYDQLYFVTTGIDISSSPGYSYRYYSPLSIFDNELAATLYPPPRYPSGRYTKFNVGNSWIYLATASSGVKIKMTTSDQGIYSLILPANPSAAFSRDFFYTGLHEITDTKFTVGEADRDVLDDLVFARACDALVLDEASKDQPTKPQQVIDYYIKMSAKYSRSVKKIECRGKSIF